jgi:hypothetical protein
MRDAGKSAQWAEWRTPVGNLPVLWFWRHFRRSVTVQPALVPPDANAGSRFELEFFQDVLHVLLDGARAAIQNFSDLLVALSGDDPFDDFEFAPGQIRRLSLGYAQAR